MARRSQVARFIRVHAGGHWEWTAPKKPTFREMRTLFGYRAERSRPRCGHPDCLNPMHDRPGHPTITGAAA